MIFIRIKLANPRGFCAGVRRALNMVEQIKRIYGTPIYVKHKLVHNDYIISELSKSGIIFVETLSDVPNGSVLVFSAHGVSNRIKLEAKNKNLIIFDATCPLVNKVHMEVSRAGRMGMEVILIGHSGHPEIEGIIDEYIYTQLDSNIQIYLIESKKDAWSVQVNQPDDLYFATQTTLSIDDTIEIITILRQRFPKILGPRKDDICYATSNRQIALKTLIQLVEIIFVVGSDNSSNSNRLLELAYNSGKPAYLVNNEKDIQKHWLYNINDIGITAGASAPDILIHQILEKLRLISMDNFIVEEILGIEEKIFFDIPKILRDT